MNFLNIIIRWHYWIVDCAEQYTMYGWRSSGGQEDTVTLCRESCRVQCSGVVCTVESAQFWFVQCTPCIVFCEHSLPDITMLNVVMNCILSWTVNWFRCDIKSIWLGIELHRKYVPGNILKKYSKKCLKIFKLVVLLVYCKHLTVWNTFVCN